MRAGSSTLGDRGGCPLAAPIASVAGYGLSDGGNRERVVMMGTILTGRRTMRGRSGDRRALLRCRAGRRVGAAPTWSAPIAADSNTPTAINCPTAALCVGVDNAGEVFTSATPASWRVGAQQRCRADLAGVGLVPAGRALRRQSAGNASNLFASSTPSGHWASASVDAATPLTGVSCPTATLCFAATTTARSSRARRRRRRARWTAVTIDGSRRASTAISCPTTAFCAAVDSSGNVLASTTPTLRVLADDAPHDARR